MDAKLKDLYNRIYRTEEDYNQLAPNKYKWVTDFLAKHEATTVVDMGCGPGNYVRPLRDEGNDVLGVEPSSVCCAKHLQDVPHVCASITEFAASNAHEFDALICMDVLEHIPPRQINSNLKALAQTSNRCLLGIANSYSHHGGQQVHLIQQPAKWWRTKLEQHFQTVELVGEATNFFAFECLS